MNVGRVGPKRQLTALNPRTQRRALDAVQPLSLSPVSVCPPHLVDGVVETGPSTGRVRAVDLGPPADQQLDHLLVTTVHG